MSFGTEPEFTGPCDDHDVTTYVASVLVGALRARGVSIFASSGNEGSGTSMALPACLSGVVAVGATYDSGAELDQVTPWSNTDATTHVVAPGSSTISPSLGGGFGEFSGTSAASPLVAACAALLRQAHPGADAPTLESALRSSGVWVTDPKNGFRFPRLDCEEALLSLEDTDHDGVRDGGDNCVLVPNPDQLDVDADEDDDTSIEGTQSYGNACDADLDNDGIVGPSDFFAVLRPCFGADLMVQTECAVADVDADGVVGPSDFFGKLRPALGTAPGPGVTEP